jgi:predicted nucleic acid-binding protein
MSSGSQSPPCFIDTNIWLYAFIPAQDPGKSALAKTLIQQSDIIISSQVINEICVNLIKKAQFGEPLIQRLIDSFYNKYSVGSIDRDVLLKSSELRHKLQFSFWDSLIVSSALIGGAEILFTEDMTNGFVVENCLKLINPFVP